MRPVQKMEYPQKSIFLYVLSFPGRSYPGGGVFIFPIRTIAIMIPYIATASQKIMLMRFLDLILGDFTAAPQIDAPQMKIPLDN